MQVIATTLDPNIVDTITCCLLPSQAASYSNGAALVWDTGSPYGDVARTWISGNVITVETLTTAGNELTVIVDLGREVATLGYSGRRHALYHKGNNVGHLFNLLFCRPDGSLDVGLLREFDVIEYISARPDVDWWECGLTAPTVPLPRFRTRKGLDAYLTAGGPGQQELRQSLVNAYLTANPVVRWNVYGERAVA